jgi:hypothetical protein
MSVRVFLCCVVVCRYRPCVGLIPRLKSPTKCPDRLINCRSYDSESEQAMMAYLDVDGDADHYAILVGLVVCVMFRS